MLSVLIVTAVFAIKFDISSHFVLLSHSLFAYLFAWLIYPFFPCLALPYTYSSFSAPSASSLIVSTVSRSRAMEHESQVRQKPSPTFMLRRSSLLRSKKKSLRKQLQQLQPQQPPLLFQTPQSQQQRLPLCLHDLSFRLRLTCLCSLLCSRTRWVVCHCSRQFCRMQQREVTLWTHSRHCISSRQFCSNNRQLCSNIRRPCNKRVLSSVGQYLCKRCSENVIALSCCSTSLLQPRTLFRLPCWAMRMSYVGCIRPRFPSFSDGRLMG
jgi:hypothetical protein